MIIASFPKMFTTLKASVPLPIVHSSTTLLSSNEPSFCPEVLNLALKIEIDRQWSIQSRTGPNFPEKANWNNLHCVHLYFGPNLRSSHQTSQIWASQTLSGSVDVCQVQPNEDGDRTAQLTQGTERKGHAIRPPRWNWLLEKECSCSILGKSSNAGKSLTKRLTSC